MKFDKLYLAVVHYTQKRHSRLSYQSEAWPHEIADATNND